MKTALKIAFQSLRRNKIRTLLTVFGITIGIGVVIIVLSAGNGVKGLILEQVDSFGDDWINIEVKVPSTDQISSENASSQARGVVITTLTLDDKRAVEVLPNVSTVYAGVTSQATVSYQDETKQPLIFGVTHEYLDIDQGQVESGRFFTQDEEESFAEVVVLGYKIAESLFGNADPIGVKISVGKKNYTVIGVMEERGATGFFNFDEVIFIPAETVQKKMMGIEHVQFMVAQVYDNTKAKATAEEIRWVVRDMHNIDDPADDDFAVTTQEESIDIINTIFFGITALLVVLAAISLVVGGVGIMNVMYVTVVERTYEIGLRKAVGALEQDIKQQFLVESVLLTFLGGIIGILGGLFFSWIIALIAQSQGLAWRFQISILSVFIGTLFSLAVGLIFGYFPAKRAAEMEPITALRDE